MAAGRKRANQWQTGDGKTTVNLILLYDSDFIAENTVKLTDERCKHIRTVHQSKPGDSVRVGKVNGLMGTGLIRAINKDFVELTIELNQQPPAKLPLKVILALPRPKMIRRIFRSIAELGVDELIVINAYKVEKSFWLSPALSEENVQFYLTSGLQQAKDTVIPKVTFKRLFKPFIEDELPDFVSGYRGLIAHPGVGEPCPHRIDAPAVIAVGPEGGFTDYEVGKFLDAGFEGMHLGERILRVENALTAITSKLYL